jgi:hypothetical protein
VSFLARDSPNSGLLTLDLNDDEKKAAALGRERLYQKAVLAK